MNGVDPAIIARAEELIVLSATGEDLVAACATMSEKEEEDLKLAVRYRSLAAREYLWLTMISRKRRQGHF